jgi:uncharacterized protein YggE
MKKALLTLGIVTLITSGAHAFDLSDDTRTVSSNGVCFSKVANDRIKINIKVSTTDKESAEVAFGKTKASNADLEDYIKGLHIPGIELETGRVNISEDKQWDNTTRKYNINGYKAEIMTTVDLPMSQREYMGILITKASTYNGVYLENFSIYVSRPTMEDAKTDCLSNAVKNAKMKAEKIAIAGGATLDKMLKASYGTINTPRPYMMDNRAVMSMAKSESLGSSPMKINSKDEEIQVNISTIWEIK